GECSLAKNIGGDPFTAMHAQDTVASAELVAGEGEDCQAVGGVAAAGLDEVSNRARTGCAAIGMTEHFGTGDSQRAASQQVSSDARPRIADEQWPSKRRATHGDAAAGLVECAIAEVTNGERSAAVSIHNDGCVTAQVI